MSGLTGFFLISTLILAVLGFGVIAGLAAVFVKFTMVIFLLLSVLSLAFSRPEPAKRSVKQRA